MHAQAEELRVEKHVEDGAASRIRRPDWWVY
jgi:hypothetical protein